MDRLIRALTDLVRGLVADLFYAKTTTYSVVSCDRVNQTVQLRSLDGSVSDLTQVPIVNAGLMVDLLPGTVVRVSYAGNQPYVSGLAPGALQPVVPGSGSGIISEIDCGYLLVGPAGGPSPGPVPTVYFPAGVAGETAAQLAHAALPGSVLVHLNGGRVLPTAWTVP